jgi:hypothetical protein
MNKYEITMIILLAIAFVWLMWTLTITIRFILTFKWRKPLFTSFLILINLSLVGRIVFLGYEVITHWPGNWENTDQFWVDGFVSYIGSLFLSIAGVVNIWNWMYFIIGVKTYFPAQNLFKKRVKTIMNWSFGPIIALIILMYWIGITWGCLIEANHHDISEGRKQYRSAQRYMFIMASWVFFILAIGFIVTGRWLRNELKALNEDLELSLRGKLIYASWILSIPFMIRVIYNVVGAIVHIDAKVMQPSIDKDTVVAPIVYFWYIVIADLLPIASQLISMFVVIDNVNDSKYYGTHDDVSEMSDNDISVLDEKVFEKKEDVHYSYYAPTRGDTPPSTFQYLSGKFLTNESNSRDY